MFNLQLTSLVSSFLLLVAVEDHFCHATLSQLTSNISRPVSVGASPVISIKVSNFLNVTDLLIYLDSSHFKTVKIRGKDINITDQNAAEYDSRVNVSYESGPDEVTVLVQFDKIQKADDRLKITFIETTFTMGETRIFVMSVEYCNNSFFEPNATNASESTCGYDCVQTFHCGRSFEPSSFAARCLETAKWNITDAPCKKRVRCIVPAVCNGEDGKMKRQWKDVDEIKQKALTHRLREQFADSLKEISDSYNKAKTEFDNVRNDVENLPEKTSGCRFNLCNNLVPATSRRFCISNKCKCVGPIVTKDGELDWKKECRIPFTKNSSCVAICDNLSNMDTGRDYSTRQTPAYLKFGSKYIEVLCGCSFGNKTDEDYGSITVMKMDADVNAGDFSKGFGSPQDKSFWIGTKSLARIAGENSKIKLLLSNDAENYTVTFRKLELNCSAEKMTLKTDVTCEKKQTQILKGPNGWKTVQVSGNDYKIIEMKLLEDKALILEHVCWDKYDSTSVIYDLLTNTPEDIANYFYLGEYEDDDADKCAEACAKTDGCVWWTLHLSNFGNSFRKKCYGRTNYRNTMVPDQNIISGQVFSCTDCTKEISELYSSLTDCPVKCSDIESTNKTNEEWCINDRCSCNCGVIKTKLYAECEHCLVPVVQTKSCVDICKKWSETDGKHTNGTTGYMKLGGRYVKIHCDCTSKTTGNKCSTYGWMTIYRKATDECGWGFDNAPWSTGYGNIERGDFWLGTNILSDIVDENADTEVILSKNGSKFFLRYDNWSSAKLKNVKYRSLGVMPRDLNIKYLIGWYHEGLQPCEKSECDTCSKIPEKYKVEEIKMITDQIQGCERRMEDTGYPANKTCPPRCSDVYPDNTSAEWCLRSGCDCSCGGVSSRIDYGCLLCIVRVEENCGTVDDYSQQLRRSSWSSSKEFKPVYVRSAQKIILCHQNDRAKDISEPFAASCPEICEQIERNNTLNKPLSPSKTGSVSRILIEDWFVEAYCECDKTGTHNLPPTTGWIVFQRRIDIELFVGGDYENGFGNPSKPGSYWLGVKAIRMLASRNKPAKLQINLLTENNDTYFIRYNKFSLSNDNRLIVEEPAVISKNGTNVTAGYEYNHISEPMWTVGQEIEFAKGNGSCGGWYWWWDTSTISSSCSLNGPYQKIGVEWYDPNGGGTVHYPFVEMKICPRDWNC